MIKTAHKLVFSPFHLLEYSFLSNLGSVYIAVRDNHFNNIEMRKVNISYSIHLLAIRGNMQTIEK